jgi:hypothetical protein
MLRGVRERARASRSPPGTLDAVRGRALPSLRAQPVGALEHLLELLAARRAPADQSPSGDTVILMNP